jgi:hypothetical protein
MGKPIRDNEGMIGSLLQIERGMHIVVNKFWVGFREHKHNDMQREYYYEIFSMGNKNGKKRHAIHIRDFAESIKEGTIKILSMPDESRIKV